MRANSKGECREDVEEKNEQGGNSDHGCDGLLRNRKLHQPVQWLLIVRDFSCIRIQHQS